MPHVELKVSSQPQGDRVIVSASGEVDLYTAPLLQAELAAVVSGGHPVRVVVDMSGVEFCDSTGMNVLLSAMKRATERGGALDLANPRPAVRKILQVTGLDAVFTVVDDIVVDDALVDPVVDRALVDPVVNRALVDNPVVDRAVLDDPVLDDPVLDDPVLDDPVLDDPVVDAAAAAADGAAACL